MKDIGEYGCDGEDHSDGVEPKRTANRGASGRRKIGTQAELQEQRGYADSGNHDQGYRTAKCALAGVEDNQGESSEQQSGGDDSWPAGLRIGSGV